MKHLIELSSLPFAQLLVPSQTRVLGIQLLFPQSNSVEVHEGQFNSSLLSAQSFLPSQTRDLEIQMLLPQENCVAVQVAVASV